jgi:hypothetical protein
MKSKNKSIIHIAAGLLIFFTTTLARSDIGWLDYQAVNVGSNSALGRTGQWWCQNHFGNNIGGFWECVENTGSSCTLQASNNTSIQCGKINTDGTTGYTSTNNIQKTFGYGKVERTLITQAAVGRTGKWWCDNHFGTNLGGSWKCRSVSGNNTCDMTVPNKELVSCSKYDDVQTVNTANLSAPGRTGKW